VSERVGQRVEKHLTRLRRRSLVSAARGVDGVDVIEPMYTNERERSIDNTHHELEYYSALQRTQQTIPNVSFLLQVLSNK
jgi:hypothetical protein